MNEFNDVNRVRTKIAEVPEDAVICVWQGTILKDEDIPEFEAWFSTQFDVETCTFLESVKTLPDVDEMGNVCPNTGGRQDVIFAVTLPPNSKFHLQRVMTADIKLLDDMVSEVNNPNGIIYPQYIKDYLR